MALKDLEALVKNDQQFPYYYGGLGKFSQKSIPWGNDRLNGSSNLPYVKWPINGEEISLSGDRLQNIITISKSGLDYPLRGASDRVPILSDLFGQAVPQRAQADYLRIQRFLKDEPRGTVFNDKQRGLQLSNPVTEAGFQVNINADDTSLRFLAEIQNTRVYNNSKNILTQVANGGSGMHVDRHGVVPFNAPSTLYSNIVPNKPKSENRLVLLYSTKISPANPTDLNYATINRLGISLSDLLLFDYLGGPKSFYGIGTTVIKRYVNTNVDQRYQGTAIGQVNPQSQLAYTFTYDQLAKAKEDIELEGNPFDFREQIEGAPSSYGGYSKYNLEKRKGLGNPGKRRVSTNSAQPGTDAYYDYSLGDPDRIDKLNQLGLFWSQEDPWSKALDQTPGAQKDIIKFGFESINNTDPRLSLVMLFRAFLDSFDDTHTAEYQSFKYVGRGDQFYTYQGFSRDINFTFKIAAQTRQEMKPLYQKLNALVSQIYPDYSNSGYMRAPMVRLTVGDYLYRQPGFLRTIRLTVEKEFPWEIKMDEQGIDSNMAQLPQVLTVNCTFTVIHNFLPRTVDGIYSDGTDTSQLVGNLFSRNPSINDALPQESDQPITYEDDSPNFNAQLSDLNQDLFSIGNLEEDLARIRTRQELGR